MSELVKRVLVAAVGIPIAILIVYDGAIVFFCVILFISSIGLFEFYKMAKKKDSFPHIILGLLFNAIILFGIEYLPQIVNSNQCSNLYFGFYFIFSNALYILLVMSMELWSNKRNPMANISYTIAGNAYITYSFVFILLIRNLHSLKAGFSESVHSFYEQTLLFRSINDEWCMYLLLCLLFSVWISDSAAFFIGKRFGKHKLFPRVSPKKTWEGAIACFIGGGASFVVLSIFLLPGLSVFDSIVLAVIIGSVGQIGDLAESRLKRDTGVKDSSALIPGHGGVLDRFDSLIFILPIVSIYVFLRVL